MLKQYETQSFLGLLFLVTVAFFWVLAPFFGPIFWAVAVAIIFSPTARWIQRKLPGRPNLNALLTLLFCLVILILPLIFVVGTVIAQGADIYNKVESGELDLNQYVAKIQSAFPVLERLMERFGIDFERAKTAIAQGAMGVGRFLAQNSLAVGQNMFAFVLSFSVMLYVSFFLLRDGNKIITLLYRALPLGDEREKLLFDKFAEVMRATVKGNLVVAVVQGTIGGITFAILGVGGALLWGVVMSIASLIPAVGAAIVWVPVAIYLFATGSVIQAIVLTLVGAFVIGLIDNVLRPILVGRDTKLPDYLVLLSTLGGLAIFGINGFVVGPLIAALFIASWGIFMREFQDKSEVDLSLS
jgi:predicted PurR-regulated permease PerM